MDLRVTRSFVKKRKLCGNRKLGKGDAGIHRPPIYTAADPQFSEYLPCLLLIRVNLPESAEPAAAAVVPDVFPDILSGKPKENPKFMRAAGLPEPVSKPLKAVGAVRILIAEIPENTHCLGLIQRFFHGLLSVDQKKCIIFPVGKSPDRHAALIQDAAQFVNTLVNFGAVSPLYVENTPAFQTREGSGSILDQKLFKIAAS